MDHIDREAWERIQPVLDRLLELPPARRAAALDELLAADDPLRTVVAELITGDAGTHPVLDASAGRYSVVLLDDTDPAGRRVGPFRIRAEIGRGGMGAVYLAERADGDFAQRVAIKLVRPGLERSGAVDRFRDERRILARLEHANIARLVDGGVSDDGLPYFAMEYVEGRVITRYCDERRLAIAERLRLFESVCDAVHYAHRSLVVHRDLKPGNILVTADGQVKLLDFGIAKLLEDDAVPESTRVQALTPAYAAPEQLRGEPVTTATDVYALGVILYELLAGRRPYEVEQRTPAAIAAARSTTATRLRRGLAGDLDTIVLRALAKVPERRYASAEALAQDLRRHRAGLPVEARRDSLAYRARTFVLRHRVGVSAAALVVLALFGGLAGTISQAERASREATRARQVRDLLVAAFQGADPDVAHGRELSARELLDAGAERIGTTLADDPELHAEMLLVLADVYESLGLYDAGAPLVERALSLRRDLFGDEHPAVAAARNEQAWFAYHAGDYDRAEAGLRDAVATRRRLLGPRDTALARSIDNLGETLRMKGAFDEAESLAREALAIRRTRLGAHPDVATSLNNLAVIVRQTDARAEAEPLLREALALDSIVRGPDDRATLTDRSNLALVLQEKGELEEAGAIYRDVLERQRLRYGEDHPLVTTTRNNLAAVLSRQGSYEAAEALYREILDRWIGRGEADHANAIVTRANLAHTLQMQGELEQAEALQRDVVVRFGRLLGDAHPNTITSLNNLASTLRLQGEYAEAEPLHRQVMQAAAEIWPGRHPLPATFALGYARLLEADGRCAEAAPVLRDAIETFDVAGELQPGSAAEGRIMLGTCLIRLDDAAAAEPILLRAYDALADRPDRRRVAAERLAELYDALGNPEEAAGYRRAAQSGLERDGTSSP